VSFGNGCAGVVLFMVGSIAILLLLLIFVFNSRGVV